MAWADHGSMGFGLGTASPIVTGTGITLPQGTWAIGERVQFISYDTASDAKLLGLANAYPPGDPRNDVHSVNSLLSPSLFAAYGLTDRLTIGVQLPYNVRFNVRSPNDDGDMVNKLGNSNGIGDTTIFAEGNVYRSADNLNYLSLVAALKTPTGANQVTSKLGTPFEPHHQPGSGSWDPMLGLAFTRGMGVFSLDTSYMYLFSTAGTRDVEGNRVTQGDVFNYNIALSYAVGAPKNIRSGLFAESNQSRWTLVLELNGERRAQQKTRGVSDPNSGSNVVYISPGIRFAGGRNWNTGVSIGVPIVTDFKGYQDPPSYRIIQRFVLVF